MLTVAEEFLLLTADDSDQTTAPGIHLPAARLGIRFAMSGASLMELALRDRIDTDVDHLWVSNPSPTGETSIDPVLVKLLEISERNGAKSPIIDTIKELEAVNSYRLALDSLRSRGLAGEQIERLLFVFPVKSFVVIDTDVTRAIRERIHSVLFTNEIPSPRDACLISLLDATKKFRRVVPPDRVQEAVEQTHRYNHLDLVGRNVALHVTGMINSFSKYGDIV